MEIIYLLLPVSIFLSIVALIAYCWSAKNGQFDDLDTPAVRVLFDEDAPPTRQLQQQKDELNSKRPRS
jgi:cbb3-type cytochrome oxidase maturation protein